MDAGRTMPSAIRRRAVDALGTIGGARAILPLDQVWTRDWDQAVRDLAAATLARLGAPSR